MFSELMPVDYMALVQPPFTTAGWLEGENPGLIECFVYFKVRMSECVCVREGGRERLFVYLLQELVKVPRETKHTFMPRQEGNTEEVRVELELLATPSPRPGRRHANGRRGSSTMETPTSPSHHPLTHDLSSSVSSSVGLSGVWASRAQFLTTPLEQCPLSGAETDGPAGNGYEYRGAPLQGAWARPGTCGASAVKSPSGRMPTRTSSPALFSIGSTSTASSCSSGQQTPEPRGCGTCPAPSPQPLHHSVSSPMVAGHREHNDGQSVGGGRGGGHCGKLSKGDSTPAPLVSQGRGGGRRWEERGRRGRGGRERWPQSREGSGRRQEGSQQKHDRRASAETPSDGYHRSYSDSRAVRQESHNRDTPYRPRSGGSEPGPRRGRCQRPPLGYDPSTQQFYK